MNLVFIVNAGSSSIKFQIMNQADLSVLASGLLERIHVDGAYDIKVGAQKYEGKANFPNHDLAIDFLVAKLKEIGVLQNVADIKGIGHRVVHGGALYRKATLVDKKVLQDIEDLIPIAPLHNPGAVAGIKGFLKVAPHAINMAQFDTAFHATIPDYNYTYAIPREWREKYQARRYGMHGISYEYITAKMAQILGKSRPNLIIAHLGNGASICAVKAGESHNTSMSFTALAGLIMGTRSGDIAPGILEYIAKQKHLTSSQINEILNKESGLLGLTGYSDMRQIEEKARAGDKDCEFAFRLWARRIATYFVDYYNQLGGEVDAIVFTAGIGENSVTGRKRVFEEVKILETRIDDQKNAAKYDDYLEISTSDARIPVYKVRTNEELMIAKRLLEFLK